MIFYTLSLGERRLRANGNRISDPLIGMKAKFHQIHYIIKNSTCKLFFEKFSYAKALFIYFPLFAYIDIVYFARA